MAIDKRNISGFVLAGGKSSRMGSDKGFMAFKGKRLVDYATEALEECCSTINIISNQEQYEKLNYKVYPDFIQDKGPIAGICAALSKSESEINIILSCDSPYISAKLLTYLIEQSEGFEAVVPRYEGRLYPLTAVYKKSCLKPFNESLMKNKLKVKEVIQSLNYQMIDIGEDLPFYHDMLMININTKEELELYEG